MTTETKLPEGTDRIIPGASKTASDMEAELIMEDTNDTTQTETKKRDKVVAKVNEARTTIAKEAAGKTRGVVGDGLNKGSEAVGNMSRLVGETAGQLDDALGQQYGDYARSTARYLDETAQKIAGKDPDDLMDDVRTFVRKSPGVALGAAAVVGFAVARIISAGIDAERDERDEVRPPRDGDVPPVDPIVKS